ncbi:hypothetical protein COLO4_12565 [Corchorus olitorius]|uniref:Uncharacterized protein n=1 Tax=Corchorus olitorius TaxID=93759 RepID=A0A1R3K0H5_9ROSI|nr:hypothetical protein COLO4_12565 [Corchorus olitorius]
MELVVRHNFQVLQECEEQLAAFNKQDFEKSSIVDSILSHFDERFSKVSILTYGLANILAALYAKGFGVSTKDQEDDASHDMGQNASGTGMGEGAGVHDVSDQIMDEDQLLGASEKPSEEQAASDDVPSKDQKGIEMEQDFAADTFSVSEDSGDDNDEDTEDQQLESAMGETGDNSEVVDEMLWDKDNDENPNNNEKYESGPSVRDNDTSSREFRAKEDSAGTADEPEESKMDDLDKNASEIENEADLVENENTEDPSLNKEEGFADPLDWSLTS